MDKGDYYGPNQLNQRSKIYKRHPRLLATWEFKKTGYKNEQLLKVTFHVDLFRVFMQGPYLHGYNDIQRISRAHK